ILLVPKERETLYNRIDARVDKMFGRGLEEEVKGLAQKGLRDCPTASQAIGYKEFYPYFDGVCGIDAVKEAIKLNTRHYAKRQLTWFLRRNYEDVEIKEF
ncbi:MAG: tRNA (adenosine(37)-N6)-dimethylallyltransferase MiaA, partial [Clostridiales bacterium]|nr:tRNA (adenosine(37)-N6)-dimethylallyltransferase MiaA [Candidatus Coliplasma equi]